MANDIRTDQTAESEAKIREAKERDVQFYQQLRRNARATFRAVDGWHGIESIEDWNRVCEKSRKDYESGLFLLERLGAERYLDSTFMAVLWQLRQGLLDNGEDTRAAAMMLSDLTVLSYYNTLRIQEWIGNLTLVVERQLFGQEPLTVELRKQYGSTASLQVIEQVRRLSEQLLPLLDRANRMVLRNIKALRELRQGPIPPIAIGKAEQVNVANQQVNTVVKD